MVFVFVNSKQISDNFYGTANIYNARCSCHYHKRPYHQGAQHGGVQACIGRDDTGCSFVKAHILFLNRWSNNSYADELSMYR